MATRKPRAGKKRKSASKRAAGRGSSRGGSGGAGEQPEDAADGAEIGAGEGDEEVEAEVLVGEVVGVGDVDEPGTADDAALDKLVGKAPKPDKRRKSLVVHDPLAAYIQETRQFPLLSREDEHDLAVEYAENDDLAAARRLVEANLRLVVKIAYEYRRAHHNLLDLVQEGNIGLLQAVRKYDPYRGVKVSTYAAWWIRAYILKFILNNWRLVKIGTTQAQRKLFFNLRKEKERLEQLGFAPDTKLLAERLDVREKDVVEMEKRLAAPDASLDAPVGRGDDDGGGARTRLDYMENQSSARPDREVEQSEFHSLLREKLEMFGETLEGREDTIFRERWLTEEPLTLQQVGDRYGVSRERARQIEKRLMGRLRKHLEQELGTAVDIGALLND